MKPVHGDSVSNASFSCTSYACSSDTGRLSRYKIDRLIQEKCIPLRQSKLLEKLVKTKALYEELRTQLLTNNYSPRNKIFETRIDPEEAGKSDIIALIDLVDKGVILGPKTTKERSEYSSYSNYRSKTRIEYVTKESRQRQIRPGRYLNSKSSTLSTYKSRDELRLGVKFKTKNIKSDPCTCIFKYGEFFKHNSKEVLKKVRHELPNKFNKKNIKSSIGKCESKESRSYCRLNAPNKKLFSYSVINSEVPNTHLKINASKRSNHLRILKENVILSPTPNPRISYKINEEAVKNGSKNTDSLKYKSSEYRQTPKCTRIIEKSVPDNRHISLCQSAIQKAFSFCSFRRKSDHKISIMHMQNKEYQKKQYLDRKMSSNKQKRVMKKLQGGGHALKRCFCISKLKTKNISNSSQITSIVSDTGDSIPKAKKPCDKSFFNIRKRFYRENSKTSIQEQSIKDMLLSNLTSQTLNTAFSSNTLDSSVKHLHVHSMMAPSLSTPQNIKRMETTCLEINHSNKSPESVLPLPISNNVRLSSREKNTGGLHKCVDLKKSKNNIAKYETTCRKTTVISLSQTVTIPKINYKSVNGSISTESTICYYDEIEKAELSKPIFQRADSNISIQKNDENRTRLTKNKNDIKKSRSSIKFQSQLNDCKNTHTFFVTLKNDFPIKTYKPKEILHDQSLRHDSNLSAFKEKVRSACGNCFKQNLTSQNKSCSKNYDIENFLNSKDKLQSSDRASKRHVYPPSLEEKPKATTKNYNTDKTTGRHITSVNNCKNIATPNALLEKATNMSRIVGSYYPNLQVDQLPEYFHTCMKDMKGIDTISTSYHKMKAQKNYIKPAINFNAYAAKSTSKTHKYRQKYQEGAIANIKNRKKYNNLTEMSRNKISTTRFNFELVNDPLLGIGNSQIRKYISESKMNNPKTFSGVMKVAKTKEILTPKRLKTMKNSADVRNSKKRQRFIKLVKSCGRRKSAKFKVFEPIIGFNGNKFIVQKSKKDIPNIFLGGKGGSPTFNILKTNCKHIHEPYTNQKSPFSNLSSPVFVLSSKKIQSLCGSNNSNPFKTTSNKTMQIKSKLKDTFNSIKNVPLTKQIITPKPRNYLFARDRHSSIHVCPSQIVKSIPGNCCRNSVSPFKRCFCTMNLLVDNCRFESSSKKPNKYKPRFYTPGKYYSCKLKNIIMNKLKRRISALSDTETRSESSFSVIGKSKSKLQPCSAHYPKRRMKSIRTGFKYQVLPKQTYLESQNVQSDSACKLDVEFSTDTPNTSSVTSFENKQTKIIYNDDDDKSKKSISEFKHIQLKRKLLKQNSFHNRRCPRSKYVEDDPYECAKPNISNSFLKRCFCTTKSHGINMNVCPKRAFRTGIQAHQRLQTRAFETHKYGMGVPMSTTNCPYKCIKLRKKKYTTENMLSTIAITTSRSTSIDCVPPESSKARLSRSSSDSLIEEHSQIIIYKKGTEQKKESMRQAVNMKSLCSYNLECYNNQQHSNCDNFLSNTRNLKCMKGNMHNIVSSRSRNDIKRSIARRSYFNDSNSRRTNNYEKASNSSLRKNLCNVKYKDRNYKLLKHKRHQVGTSDHRTLTPFSNLISENEKSAMKVYNVRAYPNKLEPYECEPGFCIPGECDPYDCLRRIKQRNRSSSGSSTDHVQTASASNMTRIEPKPKTKHRDTEAQFVPQRKRPVEVTPSFQPSSSSGSKQAVNIGSSFKFNMEFYKDLSSDYPRYKPSETKYERPRHVTHITTERHSGVKKTQHTAQDIDSTTQKTQTNRVSFLKRCFCTRLTKETKDKHKKKEKEVSTETRQIVAQNYYAEKGTITKKKYTHHSKTLDPNECEPGFCTPGDCDPLVCLERIKKRKKGIQATNTDRYKARSVASSISETKQTRQTKPQKIPRPAKTNADYDSKVVTPGSTRQAVRLGSSFSFNIEFYKESIPAPPPVYIPKPVKPPKTINRGVAPTRRERRDNLIQSQIITESKASGPTLKRCFCTLKLEKIGKQQTKDKTVTGVTYKAVGTRVRAKPQVTPTGRDFGIGTKGKYHLEPYECEPGVCIPGECDPYECLERIKARNRNLGSEKVRTKTKSITTPVVKKPKIPKATRTEYEKPPRPSRALENINHQAVRLGSSFSFNVEFYKDRSKASLPTYNPSVKESPQYTPIKYKTSTSSSKYPNKHQNTNTYGYQRRGAKVQSIPVPTESVGSGRGSILKRCFCTLTLQRAEVKTIMNTLRTLPLEKNKQDKNTSTETNFYIPKTALRLNCNSSEFSIEYDPSDVNADIRIERTNIGHSSRISITRIKEREKADVTAGFLLYRPQRKHNKRTSKEKRIIKKCSRKKVREIIIEPVKRQEIPSTDVFCPRRVNNVKLQHEIRCTPEAGNISRAETKHEPPEKMLIKIRSSIRHEGNGQQKHLKTVIVPLKVDTEKEILNSNMQIKGIEKSKLQEKSSQAYSVVRVKSESPIPISKLSPAKTVYEIPSPNPEVDSPLKSSSMTGAEEINATSDSDSIIKSLSIQKPLKAKKKPSSPKYLTVSQMNKNKTISTNPKQYWVQYQIHSKLRKSSIDTKQIADIYSKQKKMHVTEMETIMSYSPSNYNRTKSETVLNYKSHNNNNKVRAISQSNSKFSVRADCSNRSNKSPCSVTQRLPSEHDFSLQNICEIKKTSIMKDKLTETKINNSCSKLKQNICRCLGLFLKTTKKKGKDNLLKNYKNNCTVFKKSKSDLLDTNKTGSVKTKVCNSLYKCRNIGSANNLFQKTQSANKNCVMKSLKKQDLSTFLLLPIRYNEYSSSSNICSRGRSRNLQNMSQKIMYMPSVFHKKNIYANYKNTTAKLQKLEKKNSSDISSACIGNENKSPNFHKCPSKYDKKQKILKFDYTKDLLAQQKNQPKIKLVENALELKHLRLLPSSYSSDEIKNITRSDQTGVCKIAFLLSPSGVNKVLLFQNITNRDKISCPSWVFKQIDAFRLNHLKGHSKSCPCLGHKKIDISRRKNLKLFDVNNSATFHRNKTSCNCRNMIREKESKTSALEKQLKSKSKPTKKKKCKVCAAKVNKEILELNNKILKVDKQILEAKKMSRQIKKQLMNENMYINKNAVNLRKVEKNNKLSIKCPIGSNNSPKMLFLTDSLWDFRNPKMAHVQQAVIYPKCSYGHMTHVGPEPTIATPNRAEIIQDLNFIRPGEKTNRKDTSSYYLRHMNTTQKSKHRELFSSFKRSTSCCNLAKVTLGTKPHRFVYYKCPRFYPRSQSSTWKRFTGTLLLALSFVAWSPCYVATRLFNNMVCCMSCTK